MFDDFIEFKLGAGVIEYNYVDMHMYMVIKTKFYYFIYKKYSTLKQVRIC